MIVGVIDYGVGNLGSIVNALEVLEVYPKLIDKPYLIDDVECCILPGVGAYADCMQILNNQGWTEAIKENIEYKKKPLLGICIGMQLLSDYGIEGSSNGQLIKGLGLIPGEVKSLSTLNCLKRVPHVGWNNILKKKKNILLDNIKIGTDFYYVHSYAFLPKNEEHVLAYTDYGILIPSVINKNNIWGTQFHPEKSSKAGLRILKNFISASNVKS